MRDGSEADRDPRADRAIEAAGPLDLERRGKERREGAPAFATVRDEDLRPHEGLRYIARLFKVIAILLILLLIAEIIIGLVQLGAESIPTLLVEATRLIVFAALLWGAGDIAMMLIESNHDLRASRILLGRMNGRIQKITDIQSDELELLAGNPSLRRHMLTRNDSLPGTLDEG